MRVKKIAYIVVGSVLAGLGSHQAYAADAVPAYVKASIETSARPRTEHKADAAMKPADALMFSGVKPGMTVVDILPGTGYFTRLISGVVGDKGAVYMLVPFATGLDDEARRGPAVLDINQNRPMTRIDSAYSVEAQPPYKNNLTVYWEQINNMFSFPKQIDVVFAAGAYHVLKSDEFAKLDMAKANQNIYRAVKNGGYYVVIDNVAKAGSGFSAAKTLNRVEANTVKAEVIAAGFVLDAESAFGANPSDDHGAAATNPQSTDRFALRFKKPATAPNTNKRPPDTKAAVAGYFGNTRRGSVGEKNERRVLYHPDLT